MVLQEWKMLRQISKFILSVSILFTLIGNTQGRIYAYDCTVEGSNAPRLEQIVCPFARVINVMIYAAGAALVLMLLWGAIKLALAVGDPKGMQAASMTWTYALVGFAVIVGGVLIITIMGRLLGWTIGDPFSVIYTSIQDFGQELEIR